MTTSMMPTTNLAKNKTIFDWDSQLYTRGCENRILGGGLSPKVGRKYGVPEKRVSRTAKLRQRRLLDHSFSLSDTVSPSGWIKFVVNSTLQLERWVSLIATSSVR